MDKLKPVLKQIFWILFGIALLIPIIGWFLGTGTMAEAIETRIATLNGLNPTPGATVPNDSWIEQVSKIKVEREERLETASDFLWEQQQQYMTWPRRMQPEIEERMFEEAIEVRGLETYRRGFNAQVDQLRAIVDPYEFDEKTYRYKGKVVLDYSALPNLPDATTQWPSGPPTSKEVWYLQEDLWLLRGLLESIRDTNLRAGSDANILKVPIKEVTSIVLQGGNPEALEAGAAGGAGGYGADGGYGDTGGGMPMGPPMGMSTMGTDGGYGEGMGGAGASAALDFPLEEEVGPATPVAAAGGEFGADAGGYGADAGGYAGAHAGGGGMPGGPMGMGATANPITDLKRYVDDGDLPYKTRAFKMTLIMDHRQLPEFLVELTNSPFPVRVLRVHWAQLNEEQFYAAASGISGGYGESTGMSRGGRGSRGGLGATGSRGAGAMGLGGRQNFGDTGGGMPGGSRGGLGRRPSPALGAGGLGAGLGSRGVGGSRSPLGMPGGGLGTGMRPPGRGLGMPGMSGGYGEYGDGGGGMMGTEQSADLYAQAMQDPYLAQVVVGGLMTIYRDPAEVEAAAEGTLEVEEEPVGDSDLALPPEDMLPEEVAPEEGLDATAPEAAGSDAVDPATADPNAADPSAEGTLPEAAPDAEQPPVASEASDTATPLDESETADPNQPGGEATAPPPQ